jgi:hypothetical protein
MHRLFGKRRFLISSVGLMVLIPMIAVAQVAWVKSFDEALKQASREKKFIVMDMSASW